MQKVFALQKVEYFSSSLNVVRFYERQCALLASSDRITFINNVPMCDLFKLESFDEHQYISII